MKQRILFPSNAMIPADPSLSVAERVDAACDRFESEWKAGRQPRIDDFLVIVPETGRDQLRQALLAIELELQGGAAAETSVSRGSVRSGEDSTPNATVQHLSGAPSAIGRFEIRGTLGSGAFGLVYRAHDPQLGREVAIKVPLDSAVATDADRSRFLKEARAAATINHPNICQIHEVGEAEGRPYIVMALVPGQSLAETIKARKEPLPEKQAALIVRKIALALAAAHDKGIIHRDLKPANVMFDRERKDIIVMDFGLARSPKLADARGTQSGVIMGTPSYMSPEQASGGSKDVGPAGDVFSLGVILYELLTGTRPFSGTATEVIGQILHVEPEKPSQRRSGIEPRLEAVCLKAMAKDPTARYASMKEFALAVDTILRVAKPASGSAATVQANKTRRDGEASTASTNMADVFAAMSMDRKQLRVETAAVVEAAIAKHRTPRWIFVAVALSLVLGLSAVAGIVFFTRSDKVKVDLTVVLSDVDLSDKSLSFFLDDEPVAAEVLANRVELKPGEHVFVVKRGKDIVKRMLFTVAGGRDPGITVKDITPPKEPPPALKPSPLDLLNSADIPDAVLTKIYGGRANAPRELVAIYPNIRPDREDDYHGFDIGADGRTLVTASYPWDMIEVRNLANGRKFKELGIKEPRGSPFFAWLKIAPDGNTVYGLRKAEAHRPRKTEDLYAFNIQGRELWRKPIRSNWSTPALSPDGATLVAADFDERVNVLHVLDAKTGAERTEWSGILVGPTCRFQFSPNGQTLAVMSASVLKLVNVKDGNVTKTLSLPKAPGGPEFSWDGKKLYHSHNWQEAEDYVAETDLATDQTREYRLPPKGCRMGVPNPAFPILATSDEKNIHFWDADVGPKQKPYTISIGCAAERFRFTPEGRYLVVGCDNGIFVFRVPVERKVSEWKQINGNAAVASNTPEAEDRAFAEWLISIGVGLVTVSVDGEPENGIGKLADLPARPFRVIAFDSWGNTKITDRTVDPVLRWIERRRVERVAFFLNPIGDETVRRLVKQASLKKVYLGATNITRACIPDLATRTDLVALQFQDRPIGDADVEKLRGLINLAELGLDNTPVTDASLKHLRGMKKLRALGLASTAVTGAGLDELAGLPIEHLALGNTKVRGAEGLARLKKLPELKIVGLNGLLLADADLKPLTECKSIEQLNLHDNRITDAGLDELATMKWLKLLTIDHAGGRNPVTPAGVERLRKALPNCNILYEMPAPPADLDRAAAELVQSLGGQLSLHVGNNPNVGINKGDKLPTSPFRIRVVNLYDRKGATDNTLAQLRLGSLSELIEINLAVTAVTDAGLVHLRDAKSLQRIILSRVPIKGPGLAYLAELPQLRSLELDGYPQFTNAGMPHLRQLTRITHLSLPEPRNN